MFYTGQHIKMDKAQVGMEGGQYPIVCAAAVVEDATSDQLFIVVVTQAAYNMIIWQHESLLHTDQARLHGVKINDLPSCFKDVHGNIGKQSLETEGRGIAILHDGSKYYMKIHEPTDKELDMYPIIELTSQLPWDMQSQLASLRRSKRKLNKYSKEEIEAWSKKLVRKPAFIAKKTLEATTQFMDTVEQRQGQCLTSISRLECLHGGLEDFKKDSTLIHSSQTQGQQENFNVDKSLSVPRVPTLVLI